MCRRGRSPSSWRASRQPKRVPALPVVVSRAHRHDARAWPRRLRTTQSGGTHEELSQSGGSALALRARHRRGRSPSWCLCHARQREPPQRRPLRQPVAPLPVVVSCAYRHDARAWPRRLRTTQSGGTHEGLSQSGGSALALRARRRRGRSPSWCLCHARQREPPQRRPLRQPVPPLPVVVSRAHRHGAWACALRLRTTSSGGFVCVSA